MGYKKLDKFFSWWRIQKVIKHIPENSVLLDIGCGPDFHFLKSVKQKIKGGIGIDKKAKAYKDSKLEIKKFEISKTLPFANQSLDTITILAVLEHLQLPENILRQCFLALRTKGKLILTTPSPRAKTFLEFSAFRIKIIDPEQIKNHKNYFSSKDIQRMLISAGFERKKIKIRSFELGVNNLAIAEK